MTYHVHGGVFRSLLALTHGGDWRGPVQLSGECALRLPDFLIIGAMKAGTTTLYGDLMTNSQVFMPDDKEPHCLVREDVLRHRGQRYYAGLFKAARSDQICGEASTGYSKASRFPGVALRAKQVLRHDLKLIYLVREPVARAISHHHNEIHNPTVPTDINEAIRVHAPLIEFGMYTMQLKPWLETFGREQLHIVQFEQRSVGSSVLNPGSIGSMSAAFTTRRR